MPGVSTNECPVSLISPDSLVMIELSNRSRRLPDMRLFGEAHRLPARLVDGLEVLAVEIKRTTDILDTPAGNTTQSEELRVARRREQDED